MMLVGMWTVVLSTSTGGMCLMLCDFVADGIVDYVIISSSSSTRALSFHMEC